MAKLYAAADTLAGRMLLVAAFVLGGFAAAALLPATPDEVSRIDDVRRTLSGESYPFYWPAGNILTIFANPLFHAGVMGDLESVRLFNFTLSAIPLCWLVIRCPHPGALLVLPPLMPYAWLVMSTASQQGLMLALLVIFVWAVGARRHGVVFLAAVALYLVNPALVIVVPGALLLAMFAGRPLEAALVGACAGVLLFLALALAAWMLTGEFRPTLSSNGQINIWLGNNPDPLSHCGVGPPPGATGPMGGTLTFVREDTAAFVANLGRKAVLYWMPWDYMRSGLGGNLQPVIFAYIAVAQVLVYGTLLALWRRVNRDVLLISLAIGLLAWLLYTAFFVKVRFRVPFDLLLFAACMMPALPLQRRESAGRKNAAET